MDRATDQTSTRDRRIARRREVKDIIYYLQSGLHERNRDYSDQAGSSQFTRDVGEVPYDREHEMLWGDPIGWRVVIGIVEDTDAIYLKVYDRGGTLYAELAPYTDFGYSVGRHWLHDGNLP